MEHKKEGNRCECQYNSVNINCPVHSKKINAFPFLSDMQTSEVIDSVFPHKETVQDQKQGWEERFAEMIGENGNQIKTQKDLDELKSFISQEISLALSSYKRALLERKKAYQMNRSPIIEKYVSVEDIESVSEGFGV